MRSVGVSTITYHCIDRKDWCWVLGGHVYLSRDTILCRPIVTPIPCVHLIDDVSWEHDWSVRLLCRPIKGPRGWIEILHLLCSGMYCRQWGFYRGTVFLLIANYTSELVCKLRLAAIFGKTFFFLWQSCYPAFEGKKKNSLYPLFT